jgi:hypothetical protein
MVGLSFKVGVGKRVHHGDTEGMEFERKGSWRVREFER